MAPEILPGDLRVEVFAAPRNMVRVGAEQGVRLTHIPTGLVAECCSERSQLRNKEAALAELRRKLEERDDGAA